MKLPGPALRVWPLISPWPHGRFVASTLVLLLICLFVWADMPQGHFAGTDGRLYKNLIATQIQFSNPFSLNSLNVLQGMGNQIIPMNIWLHPAYIPFRFFSESTAALLSLAISWISLIVAAYFVARKWGLGEIASIVSSHMTTVLFFPFQYEFSQQINYLLNPGVAFIAALVIVSLGLISSLADDFSNGRVGFRDLSMLLVMVLLGLYSDPIWFLVNCIFFTPFIIVPLFSSPSRTRWFIVTLLVLLVTILYALGLVSYLQNLFSYTARTYAPSEVVGHSPSAMNVSSVFLEKSRPLYLFLTVGIFSSIVLGSKRSKILAYCALGYFVLLLLSGAVYVVSDTWTLPIPAYAEFAVMPIWIITSCMGIVVLGDRFRKLVSIIIAHFQGAPYLNNCFNTYRAASRVAGVWSYIQAIFILAVPLAVLFWIVAIKSDRSGIYIEKSGTVEPPVVLFEKLQKYSVSDGAEFAGYVATLNSLGVVGGGMSGSLWNALWKRYIPTVNEYSQLVTPYSHYFFSRTTAGNLYGGTNSIPLFQSDENILISLGVYAVVSNIPRAFSEFKLTERIVSNDGYWDLYLYERSGTFSIVSPKTWSFKGGLNEIYDEMRSPSFNSSSKVLTQEPLKDNLVEAHSINLRVVRGGYRITAVADGSSVLVLPIQYSHCLATGSVSGKPVRLFRANGLQTGVLFQGAVTFDLVFSLKASSSECRRRDRHDLDEAVKGLPPRPVTIKHLDAKVDLVDASATIQKLWRATALSEWLAQKRVIFSSIPEYKFSADSTACQPYAGDTDRYVGNPNLDSYGNKSAWLQKPIAEHKVLEMTDSFLGFGWGPVGQLSQGSVRRITFGHNEGMILLRTEPGARYKIRLAYSMHVPQHVSSALTISFNGVKADAIASGQDGELAWTEYNLDESATKNCNGWIELLVSTRGNTYRPQSKSGTEWTGFHFLLKNISVVRQT